MKRQNFFWRLFNRDENPESSVLTAEEIARMADIWSSYGHQNIQIVDDGIHVHISPRSHLHVQQHKIVFHGEHQHESFEAAIHHAQQAWGGRFAVNGSEDFKLKSWAYAQAHGLTVTNYQPPADKIQEAHWLAAQIRSRREAEARVVNLTPETPPQPPSGGWPLEQPAPPPAAPFEDASVSPLHSRTDYVPPRNAIVELMLKASPEVRAVMREQLEEVKKKKPTGTWPYVPYHYGMGRIKAYEDWLARLSEEERKQEIAACRARYEAHYQSRADLLMSQMRDLGYQINPLTQEVERAPQKEQTTDEQIRLRHLDDLGRDAPDRPYPRSRGQSRSRGMSR